MRAIAKVFSSLPIVALGFIMSPARMAAQDPHAAFNKPFPPFKVMDNIYFVGTEDLGSFLITTPAGHILINSDFETTVPQIRAGVEKLGFKFTDIKILLGSHAHGDHMEADALVKELTGAQVVVMDQDVPALSRMTPQGKPHPMDRVIHDGEEVKHPALPLSMVKMRPVRMISREVFVTPQRLHAEHLKSLRLMI